MFPTARTPVVATEPVLQTPLGAFATHVICGGESTDGLKADQVFRVPSGALLYQYVRSAWYAELLVGPVTPRIPAHMEVTGCLAAIWRIHAIERCFDCRFSCLWQELPADADGAPNSGEGLDAITWDIGRFALSIGTEDGRFLSSRAADGNFVPTRLASELFFHTVEYMENGLVAPFSVLEPGDDLQIQFIVAWGDHDTWENPATWFAVDQDPSHLLNQLLATELV